MGSADFLNQKVKTLGIIIDRHPKGRPRKMESKTIEKIGCSLLLFSPLKSLCLQGF